MMDIEKRIARLEQANRKLQAQQIAAKFINQALFIATPLPYDLVKKLMTGVYDVLNDKMIAAGFEESFQAIVRAEMDSLSGDIMMGFDRKHHFEKRSEFG